MIMSKWDELREKIHEAIGLEGSLAEVERAAGVGRLSRFMAGNRKDRPDGSRTTLDPETERKIRAYLQRTLNWPPRPDNKDAKALLRFVASKATRVRSLSDREEFALHLSESGVSNITPFRIESGVRFYPPKGWLTEEDYEAFAPLLEEDLRDALRIAVAEAETLRKKHESAASRPDVSGPES